MKLRVALFCIFFFSEAKATFVVQGGHIYEIKDTMLRGKKTMKAAKKTEKKK